MANAPLGGTGWVRDVLVICVGRQGKFLITGIMSRLAGHSQRHVDEVLELDGRAVRVTRSLVGGMIVWLMT